MVWLPDAGYVIAPTYHLCHHPNEQRLMELVLDEDEGVEKLV
jgi:hypothetical protein